MNIVKDHRFWLGFVAGYFFLVIFPQFNVRAFGVKATVGRG